MRGWGVGWGGMLRAVAALTLSPPIPLRAAKSFEEIEATKDARTPDQAEWLTRAETKIPIGSPLPPKKA